MTEPTPPNFTSFEGFQRLMDWYNQSMACATVPLTSHFVPTPHGHTHLVSAGELEGALPIVLLHGVNVNAMLWKPLLERLANHVAVFAVDIPGFAGKSEGVRLAYEDASLVEWFGAIQQHFGWERVLLVGNSAGGHFALKIATGMPNQVAGVVLLNPCGLTPYRGLYQLTRVAWFVHLLHVLGRGVLGHPHMARWFVERAMGKATHASSEVVELATLLLRYYTRRIPPPRLTDDELKQVLAPTVVMVGEDEIYTHPLHVLTRAWATLPNVATLWVMGAGHDISLERPQLVEQVILQHRSNLT
ncbi:MAG: alpha/beta fold hydrolase [Phototrophicaceae bacterium]